MTRETKLGLVVAGSFLALVGGVVVARLKQVEMPGEGGEPVALATGGIEKAPVAGEPASGSPPGSPPAAMPAPEPEKHVNPVSADAVASAQPVKMPSPEPTPPAPAPAATQPVPEPTPQANPVIAPAPVAPEPMAPPMPEPKAPPAPEPMATPAPASPIVTSPAPEPTPPTPAAPEPIVTPTPDVKPPEPTPAIKPPEPTPAIKPPEPSPVVKQPEPTPTVTPIPEPPAPPPASPPTPTVIKQPTVAEPPNTPVAPPPLNPEVAKNAVPTVTVVPASGSNGSSTGATLDAPRVPAGAPPRDPFVAAPRPAAPPEPKRDSYLEEQYRWRPGDSFAAISSQYYGTPKYANALQKYNQEYPLATREMRQNPPAPQPGQGLWVPPVRILERDYAQHIRDLTPIATPTSRPGVEAVAPPPGLANSGFGNAAPQPYRVRAAGESVQEIARRTLGNSAQAGRIQQLNQTLSPDPRLPIPAGTVLRLPGDARVDPADKP